MRGLRTCSSCAQPARAQMCTFDTRRYSRACSRSLALPPSWAPPQPGWRQYQTRLFAPQSSGTTRYRIAIQNVDLCSVSRCTSYTCSRSVRALLECLLTRPTCVRSLRWVRPKPISGGADAYSSGREGAIGLLRGGPAGAIDPRSFACFNTALPGHPLKRLPPGEYCLI